MLRTALTAAGLVLAAVVLVGGGQARPAHVPHHCGAQDKQFIQRAILSAQELGFVGQDYRDGSITAKDAIAQIRDADLGLRDTDPVDSSLSVSRTLMRAMLSEYSKAIRAQWKGGNAGVHMQRSYQLANYAHEALSQAAPDLAKLDCSVGDLLSQ